MKRLPTAIKTHLSICDNSSQSYNIWTTDHILYDCELVEQERDRLKAAVLRSENWPVSKDILISKYSETFKKFTNSVSLDKS